jgi:hypothetical protein
MRLGMSAAGNGYSTNQFRCVQRVLDRAIFEIERAEEEPAFTKILEPTLPYFATAGARPKNARAKGKRVLSGTGGGLWSPLLRTV